MSGIGEKHDALTPSLVAERWLEDYERFGYIGEAEMSRVQTLHVSEIARRLEVSEATVTFWLNEHQIAHRKTSYGVRVPLIEYPVLRSLAQGKSIEEARAVVADVKARLEARP